MPGIIWTKDWSGTDDGTILKGVDLRNIQDDLASVLTTQDLSDHGTLIFYEGAAVSWENDAVYI